MFHVKLVDTALQLVAHWSFPGCSRRETILSIHLTNPIMHHNCRGQKVELTFDSELQEELEEAARRVFKVPVSVTD